MLQAQNDGCRRLRRGRAERERASVWEQRRGVPGGEDRNAPRPRGTRSGWCRREPCFGGVGRKRCSSGQRRERRAPREFQREDARERRELRVLPETQLREEGSGRRDGYKSLESR